MNLIKKISLFCCFCFVVILFLPQIGLTQSWWESKQEGSATDDISVTPSQFEGKAKSATRSNWEDGYIEVMAGATADMKDAVNLGHAYSIAMKTARHLAYEKLAETVGGLNLYSDATYDRELMVDSNLKTVLKAIIRKARVVNEKKSQFSDGSIWVEVTLGMKLFGEDGLIHSSVDWNNRRQVNVTPALQPAPIQPGSASASFPIPAGGYTGLILVATGLNGSPAMLPRILSENGEVLYGTNKIDSKYIVKLGLMGYQNNLDKARTLDRVGKNPLVINAKNVSGKNKTDFVISQNDAANIKKAIAGNDFLKQCRVVAVLN